MPADYGEYLRVMSDLLALAFQGDVTRIATFVLANEGSNRSYRNINISDGHHDLSHHGNNQEKLDKIARINQFHVEQFAYFVGKLKSIREGDGTLLDNSMLVYGSGNGDGNRHNHDDLPILLVGKAGGTISTGRHLRFAPTRPSPTFIWKCSTASASMSNASAIAPDACRGSRRDGRQRSAGSFHSLRTDVCFLFPSQESDHQNENPGKDYCSHDEADDKQRPRRPGNIFRWRCRRAVNERGRLHG